MHINVRGYHGRYLKCYRHCCYKRDIDTGNIAFTEKQLENYVCTAREKENQFNPYDNIRFSKEHRAVHTMCLFYMLVMVAENSSNADRTKQRLPCMLDANKQS